MEELIFEWRNKTILTNKTKDKKIELMDCIESSSAIRYFFGTQKDSTSTLNNTEDKFKIY